VFSLRRFVPVLPALLGLLVLLTAAGAGASARPSTSNAADLAEVVVTLSQLTGLPVSILDIHQDGRYVVELSCANCEASSLSTHDEASLEQLDLELGADLDAVLLSAGLDDCVHGSSGFVSGDRARRPRLRA